jgi:RNA polymerase sigma factor for flagellar operon FliA
MRDEGGGEEAALWRRWHGLGEGGARCELIGLHLGFARILAGKLYAGRYNDELEFADYLHFATVGLIESIDRYIPAGAANFRTFAAPRIRGAVLDGVARMSEQQQQIAVRRRLLAERTQSLAAGAGDVFERLAEIAVGLACGYMLEGSGLYLDEEPASLDHGYARVELRQLAEKLLHLVDRLPHAERMVIRAHYLNQLPFGEIAGMLGLSNGRISQLHQAALQRLRAAWQETSRCDISC